MKQILTIVLLACSAFGAALTPPQLMEVSHYCERNMPAINYTSPVITATAQAAQTWVDANRGSLPAAFTNANLTAPQRAAVYAVMDQALSDAQKAVAFDGVAIHNDQTPPPPPPDPDYSIPSGALLLILSGSCPVPLIEETSLNGRFLVGTLAANANIGTTGGADSVTPAGTVTAPAVADHTSHTHQYTDVVNHVHVQNKNSASTGGLNGFALDTSTSGPVATGYSTANPTGGVATGNTQGPSVALSHAVTPPAFTGAAQDNRPAFVRVIFCRKP